MTLHRALGIALLAVGLSAGLCAPAAAQGTNSDTHEVTVRVQEVNAIAVSSDVELVVNETSAGQAPSRTMTNSSFALTTNSLAARKITGALSGAYPDGITLSAELAAPSTGSSVGTHNLSTNAVDLVTSIGPTAESNLNIAYEAAVTAQADPGTYTQTITYTILAQ